MNDPKYVQTASLVLAAASRLISTIQNPSMHMMECAGGMYTSATLNLVVEANVTEALKEAGPQGLHVRELGAKVGVEPTMLGRCLRYLCARHIYREVSPDVFGNNRLSATLDTGLPFDQVKDRGPHRYDNATGVAAVIGHTTDECLAGASVLSQAILNAQKPLETTNSPFVQAMNINKPTWEWLEQPENEKRFYRFGTSMRELNKIWPSELVLTGYDWAGLPEGSLVVDVGGGLGGVTMPLARNFPGLRYVIQDRPPVVADGEKFWKSEFSSALDSKLVQLQAHDFFEPQPVKDAAVYMLRFILHDWSDDEARRILEHLRQAATPSTTLLILEQIVPYTSPVEDQVATTIPGAAAPKLPEVLQGNGGMATSIVSMADLQMLNFGGGSQERTIAAWNNLVRSSGWKIESIKRGPLNSIMCIPA